jgi:O-antigen/teichoic acid export membrane protein
MVGAEIDLERAGWIMFMIPVSMLAAFVAEIVRASGSLRAYNALQIIRVGVQLPMVLVLLYVLGWGIEGAVIAWVLATLSVLGMALFMATKLVSGTPRVDLTLFHESVRFGLRLHVGQIAQFLNYRLDVFIIAAILGAEEIGFYVTAFALSELIWELPHAARTALLPAVARGAATDSGSDLTTAMTRITGALVAVACAVIAACSVPIIETLYGAPYAPSALVLALLMPGTWLLSVGKLLSVQLVSMGHGLLPSAAALVSLFATVVLDLLWVPRYGIAGAAIASSISYALATLIITLAYVKHTRTPFSRVWIVGRQDLALIRLAISRSRLNHD